MPAFKSHTTATVDTPWDGTGNKTNVRKGENRAYYGKIFAWYDPDQPEDNKGTYKFIHHEVSADGTPGAANTVGCSTGIGVLNGGMGGTTIPEADRQGVYDHLAKHITDAGKEAPPLNKADTFRAAMPHPDQGEGEGKFMMRCMADPMMTKECPDEDQRYDVCEALWGGGSGTTMDYRKASTLPPAANEFKGYSIKAQATSAEIWLYDEIGSGWFGGVSAKKFAEDLKALGKLSDISLRINSPGGDVFDGIAIYNILKQNSARVTVYIDGLAASIASIIAMAGDEIIMAGNATMMVHRAWGMTVGNTEDMQAMADTLAKLDGTLTGTYAKRTGLEWGAINQMMSDETWMNAEEALAQGFIDGISEEMKLAAHFDLDKFKFKKNPLDARMPMQPAAATVDKPGPMLPDVSCFDKGISRCEAILNKERI
jgi:ATP-dependent Clp protease, protease subunit